MLNIPQNFSRDLLRGDRPAILVQADATDPAATSNAMGSLRVLLSTALRHDLKGPLSFLAASDDPIDLRMQLLQREMEEVEKERKFKTLQEQKLTDFAEKFLEEHVTPEEVAVVRRLVANAVRDGKFEAMVYSFPSDLCTDSGRAINSADRDWPQTLQGKAKEFFERYQKFGKPQGFKLKAMIINFPGGMPGDIGFFLNWAPDDVSG